MSWQGEMIFKQGSRGWTESWFTDQGNDSQAALDSLAKLAKVRKLACGVNTRIQAIQVSDPAVRGDGSLRTLDQTRPDSDYGKGNTSDMATAVWYVQATAGDRLRRQIMLRGMPDRYFELLQGSTDPDNPILPAGLASWLTAYKEALIAGQWGMRGIRQDGGNVEIPILDMNVDDITGLLSITFQQGVGNQGVIGDTIQIYKPNVFPKVKTKSRILATGPTTITLQDVYLLQTLYFGGATYRVVDKTIQVVDELQAIRPAHRKVGKVLRAPHGRRSPVKVRR